MQPLMGTPMGMAQARSLQLPRVPRRRPMRANGFANGSQLGLGLA
jgi:hypothetical protein